MHILEEKAFARHGPTAWLLQQLLSLSVTVFDGYTRPENDMRFDKAIAGQVGEPEMSRTAKV